MTDVALVTADRVSVVDVTEQLTLIAGTGITAGQPVQIDPTTGKWALCDASAAGTSRFYGIAQKTVLTGEALTAIRRGRMAGWDFTNQAYDKAIYLSNTLGAIADAAGDTSAIIGRVVPALATTLGTAFDKVLELDPLI